LSRQDSQLLHWACGLPVSLVPLSLFSCHQDTVLACMGVSQPPLPVLLGKQAWTHLPDQSKLSSPQASGRVVQTAASMCLCPKCLGRRRSGLAANSAPCTTPALPSWLGLVLWGGGSGGDTWTSPRDPGCLSGPTE